MTEWNPDVYLTFEKERTQPAIDLVAKINHPDPKHIIDVGCGPGNSTSVLKRKWPNAEIIGIDNSIKMIERAKERDKGINWICADASSNLSQYGKFDVIFSNAAIHWIPNHVVLLRDLYNLLNEKGALAIQIPSTSTLPLHIDLDKLARGNKWKTIFTSISNNFSNHDVNFYYDILTGLSNRFELWTTEYIHIMDEHQDIIKWYSSTGLKAYIACIKEVEMQKEFLFDYEKLLKKSYAVQGNKKILFPFKRLFFIAYKS